MTVATYRRYQMELEVRRKALAEPDLPPGYQWQCWLPGRCLVHARVKYESFVNDLDGRVFPCLGDRAGCRRLMFDISQHSGFLPGATWLVAVAGHTSEDAAIPCGGVQGILVSRHCGNIQNVGVIPEHRRRGLGRALVLKAMQGFRAAGARRVSLEVTAENEQAVALYLDLGFQVVRTWQRFVDDTTADDEDVEAIVAGSLSPERT